MGYIVKMPKLGLEMKSGTVTEWYVGEGTEVTAGEPVAEIESEKSSAELDAREDGVLRQVLVDVGESVEPGTPIGIVAGPDEDISELEALAASEGAAPAEEPPAEEPEPADSGGAAEAASGATSSAGGSVKASPRARQRAEELGVDLATVEGTGPQGSVTEEDVEAAADSAPASTGTTAAGAAESRPLGGMRRTIAERLGKSYREAIHVTEHRTADAEALLAAADAASEDLDAKISVTDVLLKALSAALSEHPEVNATFEDDTHFLHEEQNVCIAVDVDEGLVAPVVRGVESLSVAEIARKRREVTDLALSDEYTMDDLTGGTFTVSNLGLLGVEAFDPIINPPQVAILGVNSVDRRVVPAGDEGEEVTVRRMLPLSLSFDHRIVDGADAARFLGSLVEHVENPWPLLEGVEERSVGTVELPDRRVTATLNEGLAGTVSAGSFSYDFDGAEASAPSPVDLFLVGLSACLNASMAYQADVRDVAVESVEVTADASPRQGSVESIDLSVTVDADDETLARLVEMAERGCHVSELLREDLEVSLDWTRA
jgi:pyruvate dehydrogenase E2 component (dihydrolipoamide acetyltransferase)